jgi:hypothetical protein
VEYTTNERSAQAAQGRFDEGEAPDRRRRRGGFSWEDELNVPASFDPLDLRCAASSRPRLTQRQGPGKVAGTRLQTPDFGHQGKEILYLPVP